jgi:predicted nucleic acid-binding protein
MSRVYLDTNFLYGLLRQPEDDPDPDFQAWRLLVEEESVGEPPLISALVADELAYRLLLTWLREAGDPDPLTTFRRATGAVMSRMQGRLTDVWRVLDTLPLEVVVLDRSVLRCAQGLMADPGLGPRDAMHAACAMVANCDWIVSSDAAFDRLPAPRRLGPRQGSGS